MANHLKMADISRIHVLYDLGWSKSRIARELGIHRETVARYVNLGNSKPSVAPTGSPAEAQGRSGGQRSRCEGFRQVILDKLELGLTAQRIYQDLSGDSEFEASYYSVQRFVRRLCGSNELPFRRMECAPGEEAQIDFGRGAPVLNADGRRQTWVFRIVLSHSRKAYSESVFRQTTDEFIRCLENAFCHFGGVPRILVPDNLKAAVKNPDWFDPELNPKISSFCEHYNTVLLPTKPRMPRHKGKVENSIGYVKSNCLKGLTFDSLASQNHHLLDWESRIADTRIHGTTRKQVRKVFEEVERPVLTHLPLERFPCFREGTRRVSRDAHVEVARAYYSVPPEHLGREVTVRWDSRLIRIFDHRMNLIATHARHDPGRFSTQSAHIASKKISNVERGAAWLLHRSRRIGLHAERWSQDLLETRGIEGLRVLVGLHSLAKRHGHETIDRACELACSHSAYQLRTIRALIKRPGFKQEQFEFTQEHAIIRDLSDYSELVAETFIGGYPL